MDKAVLIVCLTAWQAVECRWTASHVGRLHNRSNTLTSNPWLLKHLLCCCAGIQSVITPHLADINSRALGMLLSAYSHMHHPGIQELLLAAQPHVMRALSSMTPFTLNSVAAAYATAGCGSEELWEALCAAAAGRVQAYRWTREWPAGWVCGAVRAFGTECVD